MLEAQKGKPISTSLLLLKKMWRLLSLPKQQVESERNAYHNGASDLEVFMLMTNFC